MFIRSTGQGDHAGQYPPFMVITEKASFLIRYLISDKDAEAARLHPLPGPPSRQVESSGGNCRSWGLAGTPWLCSLGCGQVNALGVLVSAPPETCLHI